MDVDVDSALAREALDSSGDAAGSDGPTDLVPALRTMALALERKRLAEGRAVFGADATEMSALEWLFVQERTPTQLAERLDLTTASVTGLVDRLSAQRLVDRRPHPRDRRKILVVLTEDARARLAGVFARLSAATARAVDHLQPAERHLLVDTLRRISDELTEPAPATAHTTAEPAARPQLDDTMQRINAATTAFVRPGRSTATSARGRRP